MFYGRCTDTGMGVSRLELRAYRGYRYGRIVATSTGISWLQVWAYISQLRLWTYHIANSMRAYTMAAINTTATGYERGSCTVSDPGALAIVPVSLIASGTCRCPLCLPCNLLLPGIERFPHSSFLNNGTIESTASCTENKPSWSL